MTLQRKESLERKQEELRLKNLQKNKLSERSICISCKTRKARTGGVLCSRCTQEKLTNQLRDTLPTEIKKVELQSGDTLVFPTTMLLKEVVPDESEQVPTGTSSALHRKSDVAGEHRAAELTSAGEKTYTRSQVAELLNISATTLMRWEKKGVILPPRRLAHNNQCVYTEEMVEIARKYMSAYYEAPSQSAAPNTPEALATRKRSTGFKIGKGINKTVAIRLGSLGKLL